MDNEPGRANWPILTFSILSGLFALSLFHRSSVAVIAPNLVADLGLTAEALGMLGGAYFYCFALLQIPMGPMLDRIGPRVIVPTCALFDTLGAFLFAAGHSFAIVFCGRILIGMGMASMLMGPLKVYALRFPPDQFAFLMGLTISVGAAGSIFARLRLPISHRLWGGEFRSRWSVLSRASSGYSPSRSSAGIATALSLICYAFTKREGGR